MTQPPFNVVNSEIVSAALQGPPGTGAPGPVGPVGPTGPVGTSSFTTLGTGGLTMPASGSTTTVNVGVNSWTAANNFVAVADATKIAVLQVTATPAGQLTLLNPIGMNINPVAGTTFVAGSAVTQAAPQVGPISESQVGASIVGNAPIDVSTVQAGATLVIPIPLPALANSEVADIAASIAFWSTVTSDFGRVKQVMAVRNNGGTYQDPLGLSTAIDVSSPAQALYVGSTVATTAIVMKAQGAGLVLSITAPVGVIIQARGAIGYERGGTVVGAGSAPVVTSIDTATGSAGGGLSTTIRGHGFTGVAGVGANVTIDGIQPSFGPPSGDTAIPITTAPNPSGGGTGPIIVTHPLNGPSNTNITFTYTDDPSSIFAATPPRVWLRGDSIVQSGGVISAWNDKSTFGNNVPLGVGTPTYHATGSNPNSTPTLSLTSTNPDTFSLANLNMGAADQGIFAWAVVKLGSAASLMELFSFGSAASNGCELLFLSGPPDAEGGSRGSTTWGSSTLNTWVMIWSYYDASSVGSGGTNSISVQNGAAVNSPASAGSARIQTAQLSIGRRALGFNDRPLSAEIAELGLAPFAAGVRPAAGLLTRLKAYSTAFHGV